MSTDNKLTRTQREILKMMAEGYDLKCWGDPITARDAWLQKGYDVPSVRNVRPKTVVHLINTGIVQIEKLGIGRFSPAGHTVFSLTDKGRESINPANKKV